MRTPVLCEFDANRIGAIEPERHGFRFERTTTIGVGGSHCPFHFDRV
ncbi:L-2-amino-thiazoline-4-carboxylic acid hydrolase [Nocardia sp. IFM 10818]